ncbi:hypothetical protein OAF06_01900 [Akkermansiaceae bacterium]|nr:hypothetical protein [bacterium]MDB4387015.1 hypothetical protein [Akkermansiaceae bacterium]MDB4615034.1 hypothetical protein [Akkermansiaceae bacterium]MDB4667514.1 hypothetical protein [Akkermansiaceae bacterium]
MNLLFSLSTIEIRQNKRRPAHRVLHVEALKVWSISARLTLVTTVHEEDGFVPDSIEMIAHDNPAAVLHDDPVLGIKIGGIGSMTVEGTSKNGKSTTPFE